jgi:prefoldin subunit 5
MTKEKLLERKRDLQGGLEHLTQRLGQLEEEFKKLSASRTANIHSIQEIDFWLKEDEKAESSVPPEKDRMIPFERSAKKEK